jgi:D-alanyl-D-alanine carboxypeptidase (penicillin-binding protein 5/6)
MKRWILKLKRIIARITAVLLAFTAIFAYNTHDAKAEGVDVSAPSAVVMEASTGRVLFEKDAHVKMPMASTTKVMTAIVALEYGNPNDVVTVSQNASGIEGSSIWLSVGEKMTLSDMLYGLMLASGNDAAVAIAEHVGGSLDGFVDLMNKKAQDIGAYNTHFANPNGLPADGHYTTAYDLALICAYAMQNENFREIVKTQYKTLPWEGHEWDRVVKNKNKILWNYEGGNGIKTGYTKEAGRCLTAAAQRDGMQLVSVVLCAPDMFGDCMALMDYGFNNYKNRVIMETGELVGEVAVEEGMEESFSVYTDKDIMYPMTDAEYEQIKRSVHLEEKIKAPVSKGQLVGTIDLWLGENRLYSVELKSDYQIGENSYEFNLNRLLKFWTNLRMLDM